MATPSTLTFAPGVATPKQFTFTAGATTGTSTCTLVVGGSDALHWLPSPPSFNINVVSTATFSFATVPTSLSINQASLAIDVTPSAAPIFEPVTMSISCTYGSVTGTLPLSWAVADGTLKQFTYHSPSVAGTDTCTYVLGGTVPTATARRRRRPS